MGVHKIKITNSYIIKIGLVGGTHSNAQSFLFGMFRNRSYLPETVRRWEKCNVRAYNKGVLLITPHSTKRMYEEAKRVGNLAYQG